MARVRCRKASISEPSSRFDFWVVRSVGFLVVRSLMVFLLLLNYWFADGWTVRTVFWTELAAFRRLMPASREGADRDAGEGGLPGRTSQTVRTVQPSNRPSFHHDLLDSDQLGAVPGLGPDLRDLDTCAGEPLHVLGVLQPATEGLRAVNYAGQFRQQLRCRSLPRLPPGHEPNDGDHDRVESLVISPPDQMGFNGRVGVLDFPRQPKFN